MEWLELLVTVANKSIKMANLRITDLDELPGFDTFLESAAHLVRREVEGRVTGGDVLLDGLDTGSVALLEGLDCLEYHLPETRQIQETGG